MRRLAFLLGMWLIGLAMASGRSVPSRKANNTKNRVNADYAAHWTATNTNTTNITANTTAITAVNTGSGGSTQENFLGSLNQAVAPSNPAHSGIGMIGHIGAAPTQSDFNNLVDDYNATNSCLNNVVDTVATLISRLDGTNILH